MRFVYVIVNQINRKTYVGQTDDPFRRYKNHLSGFKNRTKHPLYYAMNKHGQDSFRFLIIECCLDEEVNQREYYWINVLDSANSKHGYNLLLGNQVNHCHTDESKRKISEALKGRVFSESHKEKLRGKSGWKHTEEAKQKMSLNRRGIVADGIVERAKRRWAGQSNPRARTSNETAIKIREFVIINDNMSMAAVARHFDVPYKTVYGILKIGSYST